MGSLELKLNSLLTFEKSHYLKEFQCLNCQQSFTDSDISESNYTLWVSDYANELSKDNHFDLTQYNLTFWLKSVEHEICPELEK